MAMDRDELNRRRHAREEQRKKRQKAQRLLYLRLAIAALVILACGFGIYRMTQSAGPDISDPELSATAAPATEAPAVETPLCFSAESMICKVDVAGAQDERRV